MLKPRAGIQQSLRLLCPWRTFIRWIKAISSWDKYTHSSKKTSSLSCSTAKTKMNNRELIPSSITTCGVSRRRTGSQPWRGASRMQTYLRLHLKTTWLHYLNKSARTKPRESKPLQTLTWTFLCQRVLLFRTSTCSRRNRKNRSNGFQLMQCLILFAKRVIET